MSIRILQPGGTGLACAMKQIFIVYQLLPYVGPWNWFWSPRCFYVSFKRSHFQSPFSPTLQFFKEGKVQIQSSASYHNGTSLHVDLWVWKLELSNHRTISSTLNLRDEDLKVFLSSHQRLKIIKSSCILSKSVPYHVLILRNRMKEVFLPTAHFQG